MANELSLNIGVQFSKGGAEFIRSIFKQISTGDAFIHAIQEIGTSEEVLVESDALGNPGFLVMLNLNATNYVQVGLTNSYTIRMRAGEPALFRFDGTGAIYAKANTAACLVEYAIFEDNV